MLGAAGNLGGWAEACSQFYQLVALAMEPHAAASWEAIDLQGTFSLYPFLSHLIPIPQPVDPPPGPICAIAIASTTASIVQ